MAASMESGEDELCSTGLGGALQDNTELDVSLQDNTELDVSQDCSELDVQPHTGTSDLEEGLNTASECLKEASKIQAIDKASVHRICSGQVVLTLATAVKELLENSIDAGASNVEIKLKDYGTESIEVADNGFGVREQDFEGLTLKHHTSKLQDFGDLVNVTSFGFRGEALSSLCALSNMVVTTRHKSAAVGSRLEFDLNGKITTQKSAPRQVGTTVQVQNIFHSLPVRHKEFHRNVKKEFVKLVHVLNAYCLISTNVRISCTNQITKRSRSIVVSTNGNDSVRENIGNVFSPKQLQSLLEFKQLEASNDVCNDFGIKPEQKSSINYRIEGFVSRCEHGQGRSSTDRQFIFINRRPCDHAKVLKLINEVYHCYNRHQNPFIALSISVDKESVDVNVTPDKRQIFLERENQLLATLKTSLIGMFESTTSIYRLNNLVLPGLAVTRSLSGPTQQTCSPQEHSESQDSATHSLSNSLSKLKRSFSSAFARHGHNDNTDPVSSNKKSEPSCPTPGLSRKSSSYQGSSDRGSITQFFSKFSPKKSQLTLPTFLSLPPEADSMSNMTGTCKVQEGSESLTKATCQEEMLQQTMPSCETSVTGHCVNISKPGPQRSNSNSSDHDKEGISPDRRGLSDRLPAALDSCVHNCDDDDVIVELKLQPSDHTVHSVQASCTDGKNTPKDAKEALDDGDSDKLRSGEEVLYINHIEGDRHFVTDLDLCQEGGSDMTKREQSISFCLSSLRRKHSSSSATSPGSALQFCRSFRATICPTDNRSAEDELQKEISKDMFDKMEILGQFNLGFIITKLGQDLFIVDQHATDEKYNFEMLQRGSVLQGQKLIIPQSLDLTASNETILMDNLEVFNKNGFDFIIDTEAPPTQRVKLVSAPASKNWSFGKDDIEELLFMLSDSPNVMCWPSRVRMMFASRACRKSVMIGTALNKFEMKKLVHHMGQIEQPWNCPHGRPTMRHLFNLEMLPASSSAL